MLVILLRAIGSTFVVVALINLCSQLITQLNQRQFVTVSNGVFLSIATNGLSNLVLGILCLGLASVLKNQQRLDRKLNAVGNLLKRTQAASSPDATWIHQPPADLAPTAPDWDEEMPAPRQKLTFRPPRRRIDNLPSQRKL